MSAFAYPCPACGERCQWPDRFCPHCGAAVRRLRAGGLPTPSPVVRSGHGPRPARRRHLVALAVGIALLLAAAAAAGGLP